MRISMVVNGASLPRHPDEYKLWQSTQQSASNQSNIPHLSNPYIPFDVTTNQIALPIPLINQVPGIILIRILQRIRTPFFDPRGIPLHQELYVEGIDVGGVEAGTGT